jgi:thiosulfate/3-mercaptopyruvate sulfurtransferase
MTASDLPLLLEPDVLEAHLEDPGILVVDLSRADVHRQLHVPGAVLLDYASIVTNRPPVAGLLPEPVHLAGVLSGIGLSPDTHVVAYDEEGGGKAARLLWTLEVVGHQHMSLLNGGLHAWANEGHALETELRTPAATRYPVTLCDGPVADRGYIAGRLHAPGTTLLDARSAEEYGGMKRYAQRGGHIPGAVHLEWTQTMDPARNLRLRSPEELHALLGERGITPEQEVISYCQTHHRSSHSYVMLRTLGYERVKGYPGSWSDWGNAPDTPIE